MLIDTSPDFREQAIREQIRRIDAVLYTHGHADHILGLDDVRPLSFPRVTGGGKIPLYATENTARVLRSVFRYIFEADYKYGGLAQVEIRNVDGPIESVRRDLHSAGGAITATIPSRRIASVQPRISPTSARFPKKRWRNCEGLDILFLDALRHHPHPTHSTLENSLKIVERLKPKRTFFTHMSHDLPHEATNAALPENVRLSHDGLKLEFEI